MTLGMRVRMWAKEAPRHHVVITGAVVLALFAGLAAISIPANKHRGATQLSQSGYPAGAAAGSQTGGTEPSATTNPSRGSSDGIAPPTAAGTVGGGCGRGP